MRIVMLRLMCLFKFTTWSYIKFCLVDSWHKHAYLCAWGGGHTLTKFVYSIPQLLSCMSWDEQLIANWTHTFIIGCQLNIHSTIGYQPSGWQQFACQPCQLKLVVIERVFWGYNNHGHCQPCHGSGVPHQHTTISLSLKRPVARWLGWTRFLLIIWRCNVFLLEGGLYQEACCDRI